MTIIAERMEACLLAVPALLLLCLGNAATCQQEHVPFSHYSVIEERNIFRPEDTPGLPDEKTGNISSAADASSPAMYELSLKGTIVIGALRKAVVESSSGRGYYVGVGDSIEKYRVMDITETSITLENEGDEMILNLTTGSTGQKDRPERGTAEDGAGNTSVETERNRRRAARLGR